MTWVSWAVIGLVVGALLLLVLVCLPVVDSLRPLQRAMRRLQARAADAEGLQPRIEALQARAQEAANRAERARGGS